MTIEPTQPVLATPQQVEAERTVLRLLEDPELQALQRALKAELAATPFGQVPDGAARLENAIAQWTSSLILNEISGYQPTPAIIWGVDNTPREWLGHRLGGVGMAGDNPDNIYRTVALDGGRNAYEISGHIDLANKPSQLSLDVLNGDLGPHSAQHQQRNANGMAKNLALLTDQTMTLADDGSFVVTFGGPGGGPDHVETPDGRYTVLIREALSDWNQRPARLSLRQTAGEPPAYDPAELRRRVLDNMPGYIRYWGGFGRIWLGGLQPNSIGGPIAREGGWGFVAGLRFKLAPGEAILVTINPAGAAYTGFQINDLWMIGPDAVENQVCLNLGQTTPDADGGFTYLITPEDPGIANWLDTAGLSEGIALIRWQAVPPAVTKDDLVRDFRLVKLADVADLPGVARVTPAQRQAQLAARTAAYASRTR